MPSRLKASQSRLPKIGSHWNNTNQLQLQRSSLCHAVGNAVVDVRDGEEERATNMAKPQCPTRGSSGWPATWPKTASNCMKYPLFSSASGPGEEENLNN